MCLIWNKEFCLKLTENNCILAKYWEHIVPPASAPKTLSIENKWWCHKVRQNKSKIPGNHELVQAVAYNKVVLNRGNSYLLSSILTKSNTTKIGKNPCGVVSTGVQKLRTLRTTFPCWEEELLSKLGVVWGKDSSKDSRHQKNTLIVQKNLDSGRWF